jgi:hypothetical protein
MGCGGCGYKTASGQWRWLNHDIIGEAGGFNLYGFVGNSPINIVDPFGDVWYKPWTWFNIPPPAPSDTQSYIAQRNALVGDPNDNNFNGQTGAQVAQDVGKAMPEGVLNAAAAMLGPGDAEGAYQAADEALQAARAAKAAKAAANCEKASEKAAKAMARQIAKDLGKDARREFHDVKEPGSGDRTMEQLKADAQALYEKYGVPVPQWMQ